MLHLLRPELLDDVVQELGRRQIFRIEEALDWGTKNLTTRDVEKLTIKEVEKPLLQDVVKRAGHVDSDEYQWPDNAEFEISENGKENQVSGELSSFVARKKKIEHGNENGVGDIASDPDSELLPFVFFPHELFVPAVGRGHRSSPQPGHADGPGGYSDQVLKIVNAGFKTLWFHQIFSSRGHKKQEERVWNKAGIDYKH